MSQCTKGNLPPDPGSPARSVPIASPGGKAIPPEAQTHNRWLTVAVCFFLALAVWTVFGQTLHYDFVNYDDDKYVYENPAIAQGLGLPGVIWIFTHLDGPYEWLPLTAISRMLDCQLYGLHPGGHHLTNVLLHAATAILLFLVLRKMTGMFWPAAFVAAVFAIHPLRVESVAWVTERKDVLSGLFFMLTLWAWTRYAQKRSRVEGQEPGAGRASLALDPRHWTPDYFLALAFFVMGLLSKTMLVTLPFVLLLLDYWPLNRLASSVPRAPRPLLQAGLGLFLEKIPFLLLTAAVCVVSVLVERTAIRSVQAVFDFPSRLGNALVSYVVYLWQMLYPVGLAVFYPYPGNHLSLWKVGLALLVLVIISAGVMAGQRKHPYLLVGWLWYLGMLVPVIGLLQVGNLARADRYTYLPQIGLYILVAWGAMDLCGAWRHRRAVLGLAGAAILAGLLAGAYVQTGYWQNSVSLWTHTLACTSDNCVAHYDLGMALASQGKLTEAIEHYERALQIEPDDAEVHNNLGNALAGQGKLTEAIEHYERALQLKPDHAKTYNNLGMALAGQGKLTEAIEHYEGALQLEPDYVEAHCNLGVALARQGKLTEANQHFERALQLKPDYAEAHNNFGNALAGQGKLTEAIEHYERALQLKPDYIGAHYNLGKALAAQGKLDEAIPHFQQALTLATAQGNTALAESIRTGLKSYQPAFPEAPVNPNRPETYFHLGLVLGQSGRTREAVVQYREALRLDPDLVAALNNLAWILAASSDAGLRNGPEAVRLAERACALTHYDQPLFIGTLAAAYAEAGRFPEAVATAEKAEQLATQAGLPAVAGKNRQLLEFYRAGRPYHEAAPAKP